MNKLKKKQMEKTVKMIKKAHQLLEELINACRKEEGLALLQQCQESAIVIGTEIEKSEGEGGITVQLLEEYCEKIYFFFEKLSNAEFVSPLAMRAELTSIINEVEKSLRDDIVEKVEVVFLPYKASMWDSLESIWVAASEDPECEPHVIPIPYFDKNPDGTFGEMHYEGDLYPEYVPVESYETYDFENNRPDKIFIHNPYDGNNFVTSVHPFFYSANLKKYTDCLVYVPYFVLEEPDKTDRGAIQNIEHFVAVSGVIHADQVIVQSENMRDIYIDIMTRIAGESTKKIWEKKVRGLGSPKIDKVLSVKNVEMRIPEDWCKIFCKPNGTKKKIIFYNTSVSSLLGYGEKMIAKMEQVFSFFEANKEELTLLWRPHPLIEATIKSMRPHLWQQYSKVVNEYQKEAWGIYDDSADLDRAISLCDVYYGDPSSIVQLVREQGKPVLLQQVETIAQEGGCMGIVAEDCVRVEESLIYMSKDMNMVCSLNLKDEKVRILGSIPEEVFCGGRLASKIVHWNDELFFVPLQAKKAWRYNLKNNQWSSLELKENKKAVIRYKMLQALRYDKKLFLIGNMYPSIVCWDLMTGETRNFDKVYDVLKEEKKDVVDGFLRSDYVRIDDIFYMASCLTNLVLKFDMKTCAYEWIAVGGKDNKYSGIAWDGEKFWLSPRRNGTLVCWEENGGTKEFLLPKDFNPQNEFLTGIICENDQIKIIGCYGMGILTLSKKDLKKHHISEETYSFVKKNENEATVFQCADGQIITKSPLGDEKKYLNIIEQEKVLEYLKKENINLIDALTKYKCVENGIVGLSLLCKMLKGMETRNLKGNTDNCGVKIWNAIKEAK